MTVEVTNLDPKEFKLFAENLASQLKKPPRVIGLTGNLGSGKTTFAKHFARVLRIYRVTSPTFTVINATKKPGFNFYHIDLYRLSAYSQLKPLGMDEIINDPKALVLIEWADKFKKIKDSCDVIIKFQFSKQPNKRDITVVA